MTRSHSIQATTLGLTDGQTVVVKRMKAIETFHLFSVFDGHGGQKAAEHCAGVLAQNLKLQITRTLRKHSLPIKEIIRYNTVPTHVLLSEAIKHLQDEISSESGTEEESTSTVENHGLPLPPPPPPFSSTPTGEVFQENESNCENLNLFSTMSLGLGGRESFLEEDRSIRSLVSMERTGSELEDIGLTTEQLVACFNDAFLMTDHQFDDQGGRDESGTTAILCMISESLLCFSHCGDCRGVLFRDGEVFQVTREHSPNQVDEQDRIQMLGGYVITAARGDTARVMGVLSMTRSIGDFGLKPYIIPNPETTIIKRSEKDEFIVLASDGMWGFLNNVEICEVVSKCFERVESKGLSRYNASKLAAHILIKKALDNGSPDNITVFVIDLRQYH